MTDEKDKKIEESSSRYSGKKKILFKILLGIGILAFLWMGYSYDNVKKELSAIKTPEGQAEATRQLVDETTKAVGKLMILPSEDGTPTVLIIQDVEKLAKQQQFYKNAQNNDRLLIYKNQAIIYSPNRNIIVNVGPVIQKDASGNSPGGTPEPTPTDTGQ